MGIFRLLIILAIAFLAYRLFRTWQRSLQRPSSRKKPQVENMVRCHHCQLHLPQAEAIEHNGRYYCCRDHLQQDQEK